ncbi:MAG: ABC transporter permease subunit [Chloroflexi bacterium]|nr:ABC transporter permease subunit [Chloroflexota bacterium]MQC26024.1 ABC transporter permease subunit [Chloroflexota bacterium]
MTESNQSMTKTSPLQGLLSAFIPGLGQFVAGLRARGFYIFATVFTMGGLSVWTIAQRARFPDYGLSLGIFLRLSVQAAALLLFLLAAQRLLTRFILHDPVAQTFSGYGVGILYVLAVTYLTQSFLSLAAAGVETNQYHATTAVFAAAAMAALWIWQIGDAARVGGLSSQQPKPSIGSLIFIACVIIFILGYNITGINLPKAISEYQDTAILLPRMFWPWRNAFEYTQEFEEATQKIQAPCPAGDEGPPANSPDPDVAWVSATPTCGDLSERPITGGLMLGTELTITGGNFTPGQVVDILWNNPIGNAFRPRGMGPTEITIDLDGGFSTQLNIPDAVISASTAVGAQIHTLVVRQSSEEVFTGRLSQDMILALELMLQTIMIGLMATFFGIILAFPVSFLAARNLMAPVVSPLNRIVGSGIGLIAGVWAGGIITGQIANRLGGLAEAPIQIFLAGIFAVGMLGLLGFQSIGTLFTRLTNSLGAQGTGKVLTSLVLAALAAAPGYLLGIGFSRGIRSIVLGDEVAALQESTYAIAGALLLALVAALYGMLRRSGEGVKIGMAIYTVSRTIMNIVRSIEPLIWAIVASIWVGLGPFAGTMALTVHTIAALGKLYSEAIESIDQGPLEALQATGANRLQTIVYAVVPQILPPFISFTIYRWDINVRLSTIIGLVGGGGIGFVLIQWMRLYQYENVGIAVWLITITVATLDYVSSTIRERFV